MVWILVVKPLHDERPILPKATRGKAAILLAEMDGRQHDPDRALHGTVQTGDIVPM
jgi:hypothetical protein